MNFNICFQHAQDYHIVNIEEYRQYNLFNNSTLTYNIYPFFLSENTLIVLLCSLYYLKQKIEKGLLSKSTCFFLWRYSRRGRSTVMNDFFWSHSRVLKHASQKLTAINQEANCRVMLVKCFNILGVFFVPHFRT